MPLYDYRCKDCAGLFEAVHPMEYQGELTCEHCGSSSVSKAIINCRLNIGGDNSAELDQLHKDHTQKFMPQKKRVQKLLSEMSSEKNPTTVGPSGCVQQTRMELEERYGSIF
jgi:putative FmdB family regulatory protein